ncbi:MAG: VIT1/CCC1 transporter family protein [Methyloceanibacter sp.]|jgi:VIT1/CCC1 family predicted Fe2+/Mn2+ transporter|nr:VIT1/CCC1 transporter family protein [Methyloceanibacter sp.]
MEDVLERWRSEKTAAFLSFAVAAVESDKKRRKLFKQMAQAAEEQAGILAKDLKPVPEFKPSLRAKLIASLLGTFGPRAMRPILSASKVRGISVYRGKAEDHPWPTSVEEVGQRHRNVGGGTLRAGVFGANDGLVSNTCLVMGVAGAAVEPGVIVLTGIAGLLAGAFSMAAGEFISMLSQREMFEYQIAQEADELKRYPKEEAEELALIYAARGLDKKAARSLAKKLIANPDHALDTLAREELGLNPDDLGSPIGAAISSFIAFSIGASLPLIPFLLHFGGNDVMIAAAISGVALFLIGAILSLFSGKSALVGGLRMLAIGAAAAAATYFIGSLFNVSTA